MFLDPYYLEIKVLGSLLIGFGPLNFYKMTHYHPQISYLVTIFISLVEVNQLDALPLQVCLLT